MKNKFYKKYKECYDCIKNENYLKKYLLGVNIIKEN